MATDGNLSSGRENRAALAEAFDICDISQSFWRRGEPEKALDALDQAYALIIEMNEEDDPELMRQKEDLRFTISKRILDIYASRNVGIEGQHHAIPLVMNEHVQAEIDNFMRCKDKERCFFANAYRRSGKYRPHMVSELEKAGLPVELSWLPLIESGFNTYALSPARALGLWQFIPSTGARFGLKRDKYIDERLDPEKSTKAAIAYLKELHGLFGDWTTALAAYNCGEGRVMSVIRKQKMDTLDNFWDMHNLLPRETARYVPKFMAALYIVAHPDQYGLGWIAPDSPLGYEQVTMRKRVHLRDAAKAIGVSKKTLKALNPELRHNIVPDRSYSLRVPLGQGDILLSRLEDISTSSPPVRKKAVKKRRLIHHKVRKGDTLSGIARRYHTSVRSIARANRISKHKRLAIGKVLKIPGKATGKYKAKAKQRRSSKHVVKKGDSLWNIAKRYGSTTKAIRRFNNLSGTKLSIGQVLKIPGRGYKKASKTKYMRTYRVKHGDVPFKIAKRHNMPLKRLLRVNRLKKGSTIYPGQKLYVE